MNGAARSLEEKSFERHRILSMSASKTVAYEIEHTRAPIFDLCDNTLADAVEGRPVFIVIDERLWAAHGSQVESYAQSRLHCLGVIRLPGSEATKSLDAVAALCNAAIEKHLPRHGAFIAVGGGTILDMVGFVASIYRRGIAYVRVPTTLIGMIDVGVGIKQAINFKHKKNVLGSFYPPLCTINDVRFLWQLPRRELACGMAEALKIFLLCDAPAFELLEEHALELMESRLRSPEPVAETFLLRAQIAMMEQLSTNLFEHELQRLVDFGHSFSPIIETMSDYAVAHGEAVALDMLVSTAIAVGRKLCDASLMSRLIRLYGIIGLPTTHPLLSPLLMERALVETRAHRGGVTNLVVPAGLGAAHFLQDVSYDEIALALRSIAA